MLDDATLDAEFAVEPIYVRPAQRHSFANAKAEANAEQGYSAEWFRKVNDEPLELCDGETTRFAHSLRCSLDRYEFHRVAPSKPPDRPVKSDRFPAPKIAGE